MTNQSEFNAQTQRSKDVRQIGPNMRGTSALAEFTERCLHKKGRKVFQVLCVLAPLRLCVKSLLHGSGLAGG